MKEEQAMKTEHKTMKIKDIIEMDQEKALQVDPEYQRGAEWTVKQDRLLIDSLFRGYTIPLFYFHVKSTKSTWANNTYYYVVDGQQRKNAIVRYAKNGFAMFDPVKDSKTGLAHFQKSQPVAWAGKTFDALSQVLRDQFFETPLNVIFVESADDNEVRDLFIRLQGGLPLTAQEKRDAWPGDFTKFIIETAGKASSTQSWTGHDFFHKVLKGSAARGNMRKLCASMFMQFYSRRFNKYSPESFTSSSGLDIDNFYQHHIDFNAQSELSGAPRFRDILDKAAQLLGNGKRPKIEAHMAYNVVLFMDIAMGTFVPAWTDNFTIAFDDFQNRLAKARKSKDPKDEFWIHYGVLTGVSTSSKGRIEDRYRFFERKMLDAMSSLGRLDPTRAYSPAERGFIFDRDKRTCQKCNGPVLWADAEIDHITPHAVGGETSIENARLVHAKCHTRGTNALFGFNDSGEKIELVGKPWEEDSPGSTKKSILNSNGQLVRIKHLYEKGLLVDGCKLSYPRESGDIEARFMAPESFVFLDGEKEQIYTSLNKLITEKVGSACNVWAGTEVTFPDGGVILLNDLRDRYLDSDELEGEEDEFPDEE
ncbi:MAG: DUF262 domain-containing protein [Rhodoferax sp.]|nr:DUF262 domain-containing protein [Rhodoferax sp.]